MKTANDQMADLQIQNQHLVEEYKNLVSSTLLIFFKRMEKIINKEITNFYDEDNVLQKDKATLQKKIKDIENIELNKLKDRLYNDAEKYLGVQAGTYKKQLENVFDSVSDHVSIHNVNPAQLKKDFNKSKLRFDKGKFYTLASYWRTFYDSVRSKTIQNIESAYSIEKTKKQFIDDLNLGFKTNQNQLDAVSRTIIQQAYAVAIVSMNAGNLSLIRGYEWLSILDSRTSDICRSLNGLVYYYDFPEKSTLGGELYPPMHFRCRSIVSPITKSYIELGIDPLVLTKAQKELLAGGTIAILSYYEWFEQQSDTEKLAILGATRYNAYQNGTSIDSFTNNGKKLTLKQLSSKGIG